MLAGHVAEALPLWREFHTAIDPQHVAALVISESVLGKRGELLPPSMQSATSHEIIVWLKRLVQFNAEATVRAMHEHVTLVRERCPAAAEQIEKVFAGTTEAAV
jgi:hypothetical protein